MSAFLRSFTRGWGTVVLWVLSLWCIEALSTAEVLAQDMSWVKQAMDRSRQAVRETLPAWQYDPRVVAGNGDASLNDLTIVNADRLWAVGDRGLILASIDGGRSWQTQNSGTSLNLYGVAFFDERRGVVVGGGVQPMSHSSIGIILVTQDAGQNWQAISAVNRAAIPRLTGINSQPGGGMRAWGDYSSPHMTGLFESVDQGQSWSPVPCHLGHVQTVAGQKLGLQLAVDRAGRLAQIPANANRGWTQLAPPTSPILAMQHTGKQWLAVGAAGTITTSQDGQQWHDQAIPLSQRAKVACEFRCLCVNGSDVWLGGSPGSLLMHSSDGGSSWRTVATGQAWPVQSIKFFDQHRGWMVTEAGAILATRDGGANWWPQRSPVQRVGLQAISLSDQHLPWPALAEATWSASQAASLLVLHRQRCEDAVDFAPDSPAMLAAMGVQTGLTSCWLANHWPLTDVRYSKHWHALYHPQTMAGANAPWSGGSCLADQVVLSLRMRRPTTVLVSAGVEADSTSHPMVSMVTRALELANQDSPENHWLGKELMLPPWNVSKLIHVAAPERTDFTVTVDQLLKDSGLSIHDVLAPVDGYGGSRVTNTSMRCVLLGRGNALASQSLFSTSDRLRDATRPVDLSKVGNLQLLMGRVHRQRAWQAIAPQPLNIDEPLEMWLKKVDTVVEMTPRVEAGMELRELADACWRAGQWQRWSAVIDRGSQYAPLSDTARWHSLTLLQLAASDERLAWQNNQTTSAGATGAGTPGAETTIARSGKILANPNESDPFELPESVVAELPATSKRITDSAPSPSLSLPSVAARAGQNNGGGPIQLVAAEQPLNDSQAESLRQLSRSVAEFNRLMEKDRALTARPDLVMAQYARRRALAELAGQPMPDVSSLKVLSETSHLAGWQQMAQQESALASGHSTANAWTAFALRTSEPPALDGHAREEFWQAAQSIQLSNPFQNEVLPHQATSIRFAYDSEFLYVLVEASSEASSTDPPAAGQRRRHDMDLTGSDHVVLTLDTDRDYVSADELAVNCQGHTFDRCCRSSLWNPRRWYVAVNQHHHGWTAEYAVQLSDLTRLRVEPGRVWAISAFRYLPDGQVVSWSQLRSYHSRLHGSGLLVFQ